MNHEELLKIYQKGVNKIDDYFEYAYESNKDKATVKRILEEMFEEILKFHTGGTHDHTSNR